MLHRARRLVLLAALLVLLPTALAEGDPVEDSLEAPLDGVVEGPEAPRVDLDGLVEGVGDGVGSALDSVGGAFVTAGGLLADGASLLLGGVDLLGTGVATALVALSGLAVRALGEGAVWLGGGSTAVLVTGTLALIHAVAWAAAGLGHGVAAAAQGLWNGVLAYTGLVYDLRPAAMPAPAFTAVAAGAGAASAGVGTWAGWNALRRWGAFGAMAGFSRIEDDAVLDHPLRNDIFTTIRENPGIHASQLAREVGSGWGTVTHHLDKLEKARLVTIRRVNNQKCLFEQGGKVSRQDMQIASALKGDTAGQIAHFIHHHPMTSQKQMAEALGISAALASFHVKKLAALDVLEKVRHGKETLLSTSTSLRRLMGSGEDPFQAVQARQTDAVGSAS